MVPTKFFSLNAFGQPGRLLQRCMVLGRIRSHFYTVLSNFYNHSKGETGNDNRNSGLLVCVIELQLAQPKFAGFCVKKVTSSCPNNTTISVYVQGVSFEQE